MTATVSSPTVVVARQQQAPVAAPAEVPRLPAQPEQPVAAVPPAVAPAAVATVAAVSGKPNERGASQVFLQLGSFPSLPNAESFKVFVESELKWLRESVLVLSSEGKYRLHIGPFPSAAEARSMAERIAGTLKLKPFVVQR